MDIVNVEELEYEFEPEDPEGFRAGMKRLGRLVGAQRTGMSLS